MLVHAECRVDRSRCGGANYSQPGLNQSVESSLISGLAILPFLQSFNMYPQCKSLCASLWLRRSALQMVYVRFLRNVHPEVAVVLSWMAARCADEEGCITAKGCTAIYAAAERCDRPDSMKVSIRTSRYCVSEKRQTASLVFCIVPLKTLCRCVHLSECA